ncbi:MAG: M20 family metallopeptidase [Polyangia bacterium]
MERSGFFEQVGVEISDDVAGVFDEMVATRRDLHAHPELAHEERRTQRVILERLEELGIPASPLAGTGVTALIEGRKPGPVLLLRADMDALPIAEAADSPYRSLHEGAMHACGHDAHVAMLLGAARVLASRGLERGAVKLIFQPAEEGGGGAAEMIRAGVLADPVPDAALALHVWTPLATGEIAIADGPMMASVDGFELIVRGQGTHAATPELGVDPIAIAAQIVTSSQALISRRTAAFDPAVLSFTAVYGGEAFNVIPPEVRLRGTIRAFDPDVRERLRRGLELTARLAAEAHGGAAEVGYREDLPPLINDAGVAAALRGIAAEISGESPPADPRPVMVGEDFALVLEEISGALALVGCGDPAADEIFPHHHPRFDIDERALAIGAELLVRAAGRIPTESG